MVTLSQAKEVAQGLISKIKPHSIILFGSVARTGKGNDLDLLVIRQEGSLEKKSYDEVSDALEDFQKRFDIDYFVTVPSVARKLFLQGSPFLRLIQREGKSLYQRDSSMDWIRQAKDDLEMAEILFREKHYRGVCYNAQQALEKAMKKLLLEKDWELEKTHSIARLANFGERYGILFDFPKETVKLIDSLYRGRYPGEEGLLPAGEPTEEEAKTVLIFVRNFFKKYLIR